VSRFKGTRLACGAAQPKGAGEYINTVLLRIRFGREIPQNLKESHYWKYKREIGAFTKTNLPFDSHSLSDGITDKETLSLYSLNHNNIKNNSK